jgi:microcystin-dependent protein
VYKRQIDNDTLKVKSSPTGTNVLYVDGGGSGGSGGLVGLTKNQFKGTGVATYKLTNFTDNDYDNYIVFVNGVQQVPGDAYTVTTPNITFSDNVPTNADIVVYCATKSTGGGGGSGSDSLPIGTVMYFAVSTAPVGFLECNGSLQDTADYPDLSVMIGNKFLSAGETSVPSGKFRLPDLRSEFIRGWDNGRGVDTGRVFGSRQSDIIKDHIHPIPVDLPLGYGGDATGNAQRGDLVSVSPSVSATSNQVGGGTETRPRNVALLPCIKAETTVSPFVAANFIPKPASPTNGQILIFNTSTNSWVAGSLPATGSIVAWVNFNGIRNTTNTIDVGLSTANRLIRASTNVSSVTRNATGEYTINFATALPDANYAITCNASYGNELAGTATVFAFPNVNGSSAYVAPTTTSCRILTNTAAGNQDAQNIYVTIVR